jgi:hypothetical protein
MSLMSTRPAFRFGLAVDEVRRLQRRGYRPHGYLDFNAELAAVSG